MRLFYLRLSAFMILGLSSQADTTTEATYNSCSKYIMELGKVNAAQLDKVLSDKKEGRSFFRQLAKNTHPDLCSEKLKEACHVTFISIQQCRDLLDTKPQHASDLRKQQCLDEGKIWSERGQQCIARDASCSAQGESTCEDVQNCSWDTKLQRCLSGFTAMCFMASDERVCHRILGCAWDAVNHFCLSSFFTPCHFAKTANACDELIACAWDYSTQYCQSKFTTR